MCLFTICISSSVHEFYPFSNYFLNCGTSRVPLIFYILVLCYTYVVCMCFLPSCSLTFHSLNRILYGAKVLNFDETQFIKFSFYGSFFCIKSKNTLTDSLDLAHSMVSLHLFFFLKRLRERGRERTCVNGVGRGRERGRKRL